MSGNNLPWISVAIEETEPWLYCVYTIFLAVTAATFSDNRDKHEATQGNGIGKRSRP